MWREQTVELKNYIREVKVSEAQNKKYFEFSKNKPKAKKYFDETKYVWVRSRVWKNKTFLCHVGTNERVIANPKVYDTPKIEVINGQKMYNQGYNTFTRANIMRAIKESFRDELNTFERIDYPVRMKIEIHDTIEESKSKSLWDVGNRSFPYTKAIEDELVALGVILDDNILFMTESGGARFVPIRETKDRKIVVKLTEESDVEVLELLNEVKASFESNGKQTYKKIIK